MPVYEVCVDGKPRKIEVTCTGNNMFTAKIDDKPIKIELLDGRVNPGKTFSIRLNGKDYKVEMPPIAWGKPLLLNVDGTPFKAELKTQARKTNLTSFEPITMSPRNNVNKQTREGAVVAPMTGKVVSVLVRQGDHIKAGQTLCVVEAMKMENEIVASKAGMIKEVLVSEGSPVSEGEALFVLA